MPLSTTSQGEARRLLGGVGPGDHPRHRLAAFGRAGREQRVELVAGRGPGDGHHLGPVVECLPRQQRKIRTAGGDGHHPEPAGVAGDDVDGLGADRPGRAEHHERARRRVRGHRAIVAAAGHSCHVGHVEVPERVVVA